MSAGRLDGAQPRQVDKVGGGGVGVGQIAEEGADRQRLGEIRVVRADEARPGLAQPRQAGQVPAALGQDQVAFGKGGQQPAHQGQPQRRGRAGDEIGLGHKSPPVLLENGLKSV